MESRDLSGTRAKDKLTHPCVGRKLRDERQRCPRGSGKWGTPIRRCSVTEAKTMAAFVWVHLMLQTPVHPLRQSCDRTSATRASGPLLPDYPWISPPSYEASRRYLWRALVPPLKDLTPRSSRQPQAPVGPLSPPGHLSQIDSFADTSLDHTPLFSALPPARPLDDRDYVPCIHVPSRRAISGVPRRCRRTSGWP